MSEVLQTTSKAQKRRDDGWSDWGGYMRTKIRKLDRQFEVMKDEDDQNKILSNLFKNVVIFVNGYTIPSSDQLKKLMNKYGGGFQHYYSKSRCTHIIATNLPDSKIKDLRGEKVVHPNWIMDSIQQGKLLPYREYLLYGARGKYKENGRSKGSVTCFAKESVVTSKTKVNTGSNEPKNERETLPDSDIPLKSSSVFKCVEPDVESESSQETSDVSTRYTQSKSHSEVDTTGSTSDHGSKAGSTNPPEMFTTTVPGNVGPLPKADRKPTTLPKVVDPNFISEYYSHSRLHYLSTWGAEFRDFINNLIQRTELKTSKRSPQKVATKRRVVMHIDMDSFFVSVTLRNRPELKGKPVAVCHAGRGSGTSAATGSDNLSSSNGSTSEIASCSYEARSCGVKNGMWLGRARKLCPGLICVPYHFQQYREVSQKLYEILASYTHEIQAVSCDEAFVDVTHYVETERITPVKLAQTIRDEIMSKTKCPASAGIGPNILLARMCTKVAKPNGQFHVQPEDVPDFISSQKVTDLPGVGYSLRQKLENLNAVTCLDLQRISLQVLQREFGRKTGEMLYKHCRGEDGRQLQIERERKSISAEINYGIRFEEKCEPEKFIYELSNEVHKRMKSAGVKGKHLTFKLRVRHKDAPINPSKFMGCGICDNLSRSTTMGSFTDDPNTIAKECVIMFKHLGATVSDIRGMGIQVSKLSKDERASSSSTKTIHDFMKPFTTTTSNLNKCKEQQEAVTSGLQSSSCFPTVTKLPSGSDVTSDGVTELDDGECRRESPMPINHSHPGIGTPSILRVSDTVSIETNSEAQGQELTEVTLAEKTHKDPEVVLTNDNDEFNLVLSDEELDVPALDVCQQNTKHELHAPTCNTTHQGPNEDRVTPLVDNTADSKADFPPLPVFPIFTPPRSSSTSSPSRRNHSKVSPARSSRGSLAGLAQGSPARSNKSSPGRFNKSSPGPSSKTSSRRSPVRPSAQRSLHTTFQSPRSNDVVTSMSLPSPSQIDPAVFEALPDEIQKDIENSYQQKNQRFTLRSSGSANVATQDEVQFPSPSQWDPEVVNSLPVELTEHLRYEYKRTEKREVSKPTKSRTKKRTIETFTSTKVAPKPDSDLPSKQEVTAVLPELDPSVLEALPEYLRHEVQLAYEQQRRHDEKERNKLNTVNNIQNSFPLLFAQNPSNDEDNDTSPIPSLPKVSLAGAETLTEVKEMLKLWTSTAQVPLDEDVRILVEYLGNLIFEKDLEKMWLVLKFYRRLTNMKETWQPAFNSVLRSIQGMLKEHYGSQLPLEYFITEIT